jgi:UDP-N-acetylglucosamine--N-acetylmuramyl-(pentapeptide) pyrophosphoryl-undecaprenol N-acetylglucosamine transferase
MQSRKKHKILFAVGGSGGHLFPAQALAQEIAEKNPDCEIVFAGAGLANSRFFEKQQFAHREISAATVFGKNPLKLMQAVGSLIRGTIQSLQIVREQKPHLVVGFGSFHAFPLMLAALMKRVPFVQFESNAVPGKVNRFLSKWAIATAIQIPETASHLKGKSLEVSVPIWKQGQITKEEACAYFSIDPTKSTFLVFGGSQGAVAINELFGAAAALLAQEKIDFQVLHFVGNKGNHEEIAKHYAKLGITAQVKSFEKQMPYAWKACDFAICRSGAMTIAELMAFEVPSILIPYPHAYDHQSKNAALMVDQVGGAISIQQSELTPKKMRDLIVDFMHPTNLSRMRTALASFKKENRKPQLSEYICNTLTSLASAESE